MEATLAYDEGLSINQKIEMLGEIRVGKLTDVISAYKEALKIKVDQIARFQSRSSAGVDEAGLLRKVKWTLKKMSKFKPIERI